MLNVKHKVNWAQLRILHYLSQSQSLCSMLAAVCCSFISKMIICTDQSAIRLDRMHAFCRSTDCLWFVPSIKKNIVWCPESGVRPRVGFYSDDPYQTPSSISEEEGFSSTQLHSAVPIETPLKPFAMASNRKATC